MLEERVGVTEAVCRVSNLLRSCANSGVFGRGAEWVSVGFKVACSSSVLISGAGASWVSSGAALVSINGSSTGSAGGSAIVGSEGASVLLSSLMWASSLEVSFGASFLAAVGFVAFVATTLRLMSPFLSEGVVEVFVAGRVEG